MHRSLPHLLSALGSGSRTEAAAPADLGCSSGVERMATSFLQIMRRTGLLEGRACTITPVPNCGSVLEGLEGSEPKLLIGSMREDSEDDVSPEKPQPPVRYILMPRAEGGYVIQGMDTPEQADQFFDPTFFTKWIVSPLPIQEAVSDSKPNCALATTDPNQQIRS